MHVASLNFGCVVGWRQQRKCKTSWLAINLGHHSENISVVDGTIENVLFDDVFCTKTKNAKLPMIWTKRNENFGIFYRRAPLWCNLKENVLIIFKLLLVGAGAPSCFEPDWCMNFVTSHVEMHMYICIFVNIVSLICTAVYLNVREWPVRIRQFRYPNGVK